MFYTREQGKSPRLDLYQLRMWALLLSPPQIHTKKGVFMRSRFTAALLCTVCAFSSGAFAANVTGTEWDDAKRFQIRGRIIDVAPDESSKVSVGGKASVGDGLAPEVDFSYYFTDAISAELIAATTQHSLKHSTAGDLGRTWVLPPTLTVQYHPLPHNDFNPYVGAGLNYSIFYSEQSAKGNNVTGLDVDGGVGYALQAGTDYWIDEHWGVNFDVKKLFLNVDAKMNVGATPVTADVDLDPWVIGAGVSYRF